jgi:putative flippase GtrA
MTKNKELFNRYRNFILYVIIGGSGVVIDLVIFSVLYKHGHLDKNLANFISTTAGITNNYFWNTYVNFKVRDHLLQRYLQFYAVGLVGIAVTAVIFYFFVDLAKLDATLVKAGSLLPVLLIQFFLNKYWTFKKPEQPV